MTRRLSQAALSVLLAACGSSAPTAAQPVGSPGRPFVTKAIATFDSPWAIAFLPGTTTALVTEKPGRMWLVDIGSGRKQPLAGVPRVVASSQGGLLDVVLSPTFARGGRADLPFSHPPPPRGSGPLRA